MHAENPRPQRGAFLSPSGEVHKQTHRVPMANWHVSLQEHHDGYISWDEYMKNQERLAGVYCELSSLSLAIGAKCQHREDLRLRLRSVPCITLFR